MDVFSLRDTVGSEYRKFATSFTSIHAADPRVAHPDTRPGEKKKARR